MARILATLPGVSAGPTQLVSHKLQVPSVTPTANHLSSMPVPYKQPVAPHLATAQLQLHLNSRMKQNPRSKHTLTNDVSKPLQQCKHPIVHTTSPSHNDKYCWLIALLKHFQNTTWDKWRYCNGIQDRSWRKPDLPVSQG